MDFIHGLMFLNTCASDAMENTIVKAKMRAHSHRH
jgi:hypothetical protein